MPNERFGSFALFLTYLPNVRYPPISDLQFGVANTEIGVIQAPAPGASNHEIRTHRL